MVHTVIKGLMVLYISFCISNLFLNSSMETKNTSRFFFFFWPGGSFVKLEGSWTYLKIYKDRKQTISCAIIFCFKEIGESQHVKAF